MPSALAQALPRLAANGPFEPLGDSGGGFRRVGHGPRRLVVLPGIVGAADVLAALGEALADTHQTCLVTYPRVGGLVAQAWLRHQPQAFEDVVVSGVGPPEAARAAKNRRVLPWLARVRMLVGTRDRLARGPQRAALREAYPRATFHVFEGVGHGMALEQPEQWLRVVAAFFRARPAR